MPSGVHSGGARSASFFRRPKTWKASRDPDHAAEKARVEHLHAIADGEVIPEDDEHEVSDFMGEFAPT
ncbi:hypothetical protein [Streptomyces sp. NPDC048462]|uniref:hypothetical protein n=1 Tax=Streptomyces sp. NPDC048462 TaxID=3365555 RepID=UPI00371FA495